MKGKTGWGYDYITNAQNRIYKTKKEIWAIKIVHDQNKVCHEAGALNKDLNAINTTYMK